MMLIREPYVVSINVNESENLTYGLALKPKVGCGYPCYMHAVN